MSFKDALGGTGAGRGSVLGIGAKSGLTVGSGGSMVAQPVKKNIKLIKITDLRRGRL